MSLMRRLLGKSPEPDPQKYTRVRCEACEGTGWLLSGGDMYLIEGMPSVCSSCDGTGGARQIRDADVLPDTPDST
jgi:DnaJ-class molecular chaperone